MFFSIGQIFHGIFFFFLKHSLFSGIEHTLLSIYLKKFVFIFQLFSRYIHVYKLHRNASGC